MKTDTNKHMQIHKPLFVINLYFDQTVEIYFPFRFPKHMKSFHYFALFTKTSFLIITSTYQVTHVELFSVFFLKVEILLMWLYIYKK